ncbi:hypothetical protein [Candidatus Parabeggiatoa sp. HSG14]|uniref:hypothetical protein n=1 Tax=Candidatus Parabeggiatoa sp. HSG14 TaxID=3055593 RepID=UPI0025A8B843|nr:hypothetical protein [Thiotrichales bacterium HSG14]
MLKVSLNEIDELLARDAESLERKFEKLKKEEAETTSFEMEEVEATSFEMEEAKATVEMEAEVIEEEIELYLHDGTERPINRPCEGKKHFQK